MFFVLFTALIHEPNSAKIVWRQELQKTFLCEIELWIFPFDYHLCEIEIKLENKATASPVWNTSHLIAKNKAKQLVKFNITPLKFERNSSNIVKIYLAFQRYSISYVLSVYLPCYFILLIALITVVLFPIEDFTNKITVTVSLLIVVTALFAQISSSFPDVAQPKIIEIFFIYCIFRLFTFFVFHSIAMYIHQRRIEDQIIQDNKVFTITESKIKPIDYKPPKYKPSCFMTFNLKSMSKLFFFSGLLVDILFSVYHYISVGMVKQGVDEKFNSFNISADCNPFLEC